MTAAPHPSTSSSPSRYRRLARSPALRADSVLENVKSDFAREVFFFLYFLLAGGSRSRQRADCTTVLFFAAAHSHFCVRE